MNSQAHNLTAINNLKLFWVVLFIFFSLIATSSLAQDRHDNPEIETVLPAEDLTDSLEIVDLDQELPHDNLELKPALPSRNKPDGTVHKNKPGEEALSFNFLYFIIQKFKVSDLIEE